MEDPDKPPCEVCQLMNKRRETDPPCDVCLPTLLPENVEIARVYFMVSSQVIAGMGGVIALNIPAVKIVMDLFSIEDQRTCLTRIMRVHSVMVKEDRERREESR